ncbi:hypothetical protein VKT23_014270 [Stygiomarasmius scandens]|uniref:Uncharacterized protein n=1 Tax=Marasmiellus scandens TaxID=2682957 RepID=A0ABR1J0W6_9AGAR
MMLQVTDEQVEGKKDKKEKGANETFIFVRPTTRKTNHPLNLQVQLVPPHSRAPGGITLRQSIDDDAASTTSGADLSRATSAQSEAASSYSISGYNSTASSSAYASASTTSFSSVNSVSYGRRMIISLYNLQAHNIMTNTIVDAGTDAKFAKRDLTSNSKQESDTNRPIRLYPTQSGSATPEHTPASSAVSLPSFNAHDSELGHVPPSHHHLRRTCSFRMHVLFEVMTRP